MRNTWLSNRTFRTYDDIVDIRCHAWNQLVDQPWRIMSLGLRDWAHRFNETELVLAVSLFIKLESILYI
jgi:hypothetical protein